MIIQAFAAIKFYDLRNDKIVSEVGFIFTSYPKGSFPEKNTIGINFLQASSMETQLKAKFMMLDCTVGKVQLSLVDVD